MNRRQLVQLQVVLDPGILDGIVEFLHNVLEVHRCPPVTLHLRVPALPVALGADQLGHLGPGVAGAGLSATGGLNVWKQSAKLEHLEAKMINLHDS